jgi:hypothetical protein
MEDLSTPALIILVLGMILIPAGIIYGLVQMF